MKTNATTVLTLTPASVASTVFARGNAVNGREFETHCTTCRSINQTRAGAAHGGEFGRVTGRLVDHGCSPALEATKRVGSDKALDAWLASPRAVGTWP